MPIFFIMLLVQLALTVLAMVLAPKPKRAKGENAKDLEDPTAEAGRPVPKVFGTITVSGLNVLWFGEKSIRTYEVKA